MLSLKKLVRDLYMTRSRALVMVFSIALGLVAFNSLVGAYSVLTREVLRNYMDSEPATIILELEEVTDEALRFVRNQKDVEAASRRTQIRGRFSTKDNRGKRRAFLFVLDDFLDLQVAKLLAESGEYPPPPGTVLIERSAVPVVGGGEGSILNFELPGAPAQLLSVSGIVHEPSLAPAGTEQAVYAYISQSALAELGVHTKFDELRVIHRGASTDIAAIEKKARELVTRIEVAGVGKVTAIRVPPPMHHPHQTQMTTVLSLFVIFSALIVILSSLLTGSLISTMMARQIREMGIMKTLGASSSHILLAYVFLVESVAGIAYLISFFPSKWGTQVFVQSITKLLNFDVENPHPSLNARLIQVFVAFSVPLLVTLPALRRGSRVSVVSALRDYGVTQTDFGSGWLERWVSRWESGGQLLRYALRGTLRRRGRFVLSLALLSTAGAIFLAAMNIAGSWDSVAARLYASRHYDFEVGFAGSVDAETLKRELVALEEVEQIEVWSSTRTAPGTGERIAIERTYPDGAHGAFQLVAPPQNSTMVTMKLASGRLFDERGEGEVVINQLVPGAQNHRVGDSVVYSIDGQEHSLKIVGKIEEVGAGAVAYVSTNTFRELVEPSHQSSLLRVKNSASTDLRRAMQRVDQSLSERNAPVIDIVPLSVFKNAVAAHFEIMVTSLMVLATLTAIVGVLGLGSALSANVAESTRELGVMRALGASARQVRIIVNSEGLLICVVSWCLAVTLGVGLSVLIGNVIGEMSFLLPLPLTIQYNQILRLLFALVGMGMLASFLPARRAVGLAVTDALRAL